MPHPGWPEVSIAARVLVALTFLVAAIGKMRHWSAFRGVVANYRLLPERLEAPVAYGLPVVEALLGTALLLDKATPWAPMAAASLLLIFAIAMGVNLGRGRRHIDCGCFQSALKQPLSWKLVMRNVVVAVGLAGTALISSSDSSDSFAILNGALAGGVMFLILQSLSILWSIVPAWHVRGAAGAGR